MHEDSRDAETIRQTLISAACELFQTAGYSETTVRIIAAKAGVDAKKFNYLFRSKDDLLEPVVQMLADEEIAIYRGIAESDAAPLERLTEMIQRLIRFRQRRSLLISLVQKRAVNVRYLFRRQIAAKAGPVLAKIIEDGVRSGQMRTPVPAQVAELLLMNVLYTLDLEGQISAEEMALRKRAMLHIGESSLGLREGDIVRSLKELDG